MFTTKTYIVIAFFIATLFCGCQNKQGNYAKTKSCFTDTGIDTITQDEINKLHNGDIILRHGRGALSISISARLNEKYPLSHCGIIKKTGDSVIVIHSLSCAVSKAEGVQTATLMQWLKDTYKNSIIVVRLKNADGNKIIKKAEYYLSKKIPFDNDFDFADSSKFFCSEFVLRILDDECGTNLIDTSSNKTQTMRFDKFLSPKLFDIILNHQK